MSNIDLLLQYGFGFGSQCILLDGLCFEMHLPESSFHNMRELLNANVYAWGLFVPANTSLVNT